MLRVSGASHSVTWSNCPKSFQTIVYNLPKHNVMWYDVDKKQFLIWASYLLCLTNVKYYLQSMNKHVIAKNIFRNNFKIHPRFAGSFDHLSYRLLFQPSLFQFIFRYLCSFFNEGIHCLIGEPLSFGTYITKKNCFAKNVSNKHCRKRKL